MRRRNTFTMRHSRYIAPAGEFAPEVCTDPGRLLQELVQARSRAAERDAIAAKDLHEIQVLFNMRVGGDPVDEDGHPVNEFEHLTGELRREEDGYRTWVGPVPIASLARVLAGRIEWRVPATRVAQTVLEGFADARIDGLDSTVGSLLDRAVDRSRSARPKEWDIGGLSNLSGQDALSLDWKCETARGDAEITSAGTPDASYVYDPTAAFDGLYALTRAQIHEIIFGHGGRTLRPQVLPRQPGLVLSVAYTIEFLTVWERDDDLVADGLVDAARAEWYRVAVPAARTMDAEALLNAIEQLCGRTASTFPQTRDELRRWAGLPHDESEPPAEDDKD